MNRRWTFLAVLLVVAAAAFAFRAPRLAQRPMHGDEAIHCDKFRELWETGRYVYDSFEYHGPTLNYFTLPVMWLSGAKDYAHSTEATYRLVPVLFAVGVVLLLGLVADGLGKVEAICAGVLTAISPAMVYYSRYYVQEMLLVFFTFAGIAAGWRYWRSRRMGWALLCGASLGMMHATKETWVIAAAAAAAGITLTILWTRWIDARKAEVGGALGWRPLAGGALWRGCRLLARALLGALGWRLLAASALAAIVVASLFLSGFFTNARGPLDSVLAYKAYVVRGAGGGEGLHNHPWHYYLKILLYWRYGRGPVWSEGLIILLAVLGTIRALRKRGPALVRFLAFYTLAMVIGYSAIRYKTPWCMLSFLHGMILLAGVGAAAIVRAMPHVLAKAAAAALLAAAAGQLTCQAYRASFVYFADRVNPYVYAHPSGKMMELVGRVEELAGVCPDGKRTLIHVVSRDCWPLPWYLRSFQRVGYWASAAPENARAPVIIAAPEQCQLLENLNDRLRREYTLEYHGLRPGVPLAIYVRKDLWDAMLRSRGVK